MDTLYVRRNLLNADALYAWAHAMGIPNLVPPAEMHVTQVYSRAPVELEPERAPLSVRGGDRRISPLGDKGAVVLHFESPDLSARFDEAMKAGASFDFPGYHPHVTLSYDAGGIDLVALGAPTMTLEFGPEIHEPLNENWAEEKGFRIAQDYLAFDKSVRTMTVDGHMHIATAHISKATVNPYRGNEIPDWERLGLDPDRIYQLFRDPEELARAAKTFNNLPLMIIHKATTADDHPREQVVGSTGTDARFDFPYLDNSLVVWDGEGIEGIEDESRRELSCGYRYVADMTPGEYQGLKFDGSMRNIVGNHVALVDAGRAGPDVVVGDRKPEISEMPKALTSRKALLVRGALTAIAKPLLAQDAKVDFGGLLADVTVKNFKDKKAGLLAALKPKLASDKGLEAVRIALDAMEEEMDGAEDEDDLEKEEKEEGGEESGASDEEMDDDEGDKPEAGKDRKRARDKKGAKDEGMNMPGVKLTAAAMDRAISTAVSAAVEKVRKDQTALREAEKAVRPYVGEVVAMDSAEDVYRFALEQIGVNLDGVPAQGFRALLNAMPKPTIVQRKPAMATDSAMGGKSASEMFPALGRIGVM